MAVVTTAAGVILRNAQSVLIASVLLVAAAYHQGLVSNAQLETVMFALVATFAVTVLIAGGRA